MTTAPSRTSNSAEPLEARDPQQTALIVPKGSAYGCPPEVPNRQRDGKAVPVESVVVHRNCDRIRPPLGTPLLTLSPVNLRRREFESFLPHPCRDTRCPDRLALKCSRTESAAGRVPESPNRPDSAGFLARLPRRAKRAACKPNDPAVRRGRKETPRLGFEPRTYRLTADRSTVELSGNAPFQAGGSLAGLIHRSRWGAP